MSVEQSFASLAEKINADPRAIGGFHAVYHFLLRGEDGGDYQVTFAGHRATYQRGTPDQAQCTVALSAADFIKLVHGKLNPAAALIMGKLKITGDIGYSLKLQTLLNTYQLQK